MAFTRKMYDDGSYRQDLYESVRPGKWQLLEQSKHRGNDTCFQQSAEVVPGASNHSQYRISTIVDHESDLRNYNRKDSNDPRSRYPYTKESYAPKTLPTCGGKKDLTRRHQLLEGSQFKREQQISVARFESLCLNPQQQTRIHSNKYVGSNTRLYYRDGHKQQQPRVLGATGLPTAYAQAPGMYAPVMSTVPKKEGFSTGAGCGCGH